MLKIKLDENFHPSLAELFREAGYNTDTVEDEQLSGAPDDVIYSTCQKEGRCLVTLDLDFSDVVRFPSENSPGIIIVRLHQPITFELMRLMARRVIESLQQDDPANCLWMVESSRVRIRKPKNGLPF